MSGTNRASENPNLLDVRIRFLVNELKYIGLQNETIMLNYGNQNIFQNENFIPGKKL